MQLIDQIENCYRHSSLLLLSMPSCFIGRVPTLVQLLGLFWLLVYQFFTYL